MKNNLESYMRRKFRKFGFWEVQCPLIGPQIVWKASGHVDRFFDYITACTNKKCKKVHRVDTLLESLGYDLTGVKMNEFDNKVLACHGWLPSEYDWDSKSYDLLREIWIAAGLGPKFVYPTHIGYSLDAMVKANAAYIGGNFGKTGHGANAPIDFQSGNYGKLVDYCLADVWLTKKLFDLVRIGIGLVDPKTGKGLTLRALEQVANGKNKINLARLDKNQEKQ